MRYKKISFLLKTKKGSLVGTLLGLVFLGISSTTLWQYMYGVSTTMSSVTESQKVSFNIHSGVINDLRSLLIDTKIDDNGDQQTQSTWGICSLVETPTKNHGIDLVQLNLSSNLGSQHARNSFSPQRWEVFFDKSEYVLSSSDSHCIKIDSSFSSGNLSRCFKYISEESNTANEMYVIARIVPKKLPDFSVIDLSISNRLDVKTVTFELQAIVGVTQGEQVIPHRYYTLMWSNDIVECDIKVRSTWTNVQFSGTGTGRLSDNLVVNHPFFNSTPGQCTEVQFQDIPADIIMGGHFTNEDSIAADHSQNNRISCRKHRYRCPGESGKDSDYFEAITFSVSVSNNNGGLLKFNNLNFTFLDKAQNEIDFSQDGQLDTLNVGVNVGNDTFTANTDLLQARRLNMGANHFNFVLTDQTPGTLADLCKSACSGSQYYPSITMGFTNPPSANCNYSRSYTEEEYQLGCNVCHSKMCHKIGLGTFGPIMDEDKLQGLVDEPLDGIMPECAFKKSSINYDVPSISPGTGDCVAMNASVVDSFKQFESAQYKFRGCGDSLPVLCFAYGHYLPAIKLSTPTSEPSIFSGSFSQAQEACYEMGREIIQKTQMAGYFTRFWPNITGNSVSVSTALSSFGLANLPSDSNYFDYINNATRGIFISPSYNISAISRRLSEGKKSYLQKFLSSNSWIWVAMEKDGGGQVIGSIPQAKVADSSLSVFTRKEFPSRAVLLKDTNSISDSSTDTVLTHNMRYKGVYNVSGGSNQALCRKSAGDFVLSGSTSVGGAPAACTAVFASFIPPMSSLEWVKAMILLNGNDEMYPFPNPGDFTGENHRHSISVRAPRAWVALSKESGSSGASVKQWRLSKAHFPDNDSVFKTEKIPELPANCNNYIGIIDYKGKPVMPLMSMSTFLNFDFSIYKKACFTEDSNGQMTVNPSVSAGGSCGSGRKAVDNSNLDPKLKSVKFMSQWVQENTSGEFMIDKDLIDEAITQVKRKKCKGKCSSRKSSCNRGCASIYSRCSRGCTTTTTVQDPTTLIYSSVTTTDPACISSCGSAKATCRSGCTRVVTNCNNVCKSTHNIQGHKCIRFP